MLEFTLFFSDLFDALNRRFPREGLTLGCKDFLVIESASKWLDEWEQEVVNGDILKDIFLTPSTAEGLRVTLKSVLELSRYLLTECNFKYVLTSKMNQDLLECFFGIIRQAGGQNEHSTFPTFLQLYQMLSLYSLLRPPRFVNCTAAESSLSAFVTLTDIRGIYKSSAAERPKKLEELRNKLGGLISQGNWKCEDVFDHDYSDAAVVDDIIYYVTGFVTRKLANKTSCVVCKERERERKGRRHLLVMAALLTLPIKLLPVGGIRRAFGLMGSARCFTSALGREEGNPRRNVDNGRDVDPMYCARDFPSALGGSDGGL
ncbi:hypothetical protein HPB51_004042 [Rhipicephalus microplus]|uniref:Transposable element P transposase-like RNase H C-terminal domain-containing protein n=1 Tax=Rhipicephalus microplus TaxID=6941 RepID=A0A9J6EX57_RHIMP|nr:hypothetical protein HPB51_004042 [Rhipicephalus microplus]